MGNKDVLRIVGSLHVSPAEVAAGLKRSWELIACVSCHTAVLGTPDRGVCSPLVTTSVVEAIATTWNLYIRY